MKNILPLHLLNKKEGETPLKALQNFREKNKEYKDAKMTYAGRLDPMASGLLLVLVGQETKNKEKYLTLDKAYKFKILFGFATDTYDILGKVASSVVEEDLTKKVLEKKIRQNLKSFTGKFKQKYPFYSSKTVGGRQLFAYARAGIDVELPEKEVFVKEFKFLKLKKMNSRELLKNIKRRISKIEGDFRQKEIIKIWRKKLALRSSDGFFVASFKIKCSSGTYVRGIANSMGQMLKIPALAFSIKRTRIGGWRQVK